MINIFLFPHTHPTNKYQKDKTIKNLVRNIIIVTLKKDEKVKKCYLREFITIISIHYFNSFLHYHHYSNGLSLTQEPKS